MYKPIKLINGNWKIFNMKDFQPVSNMEYKTKEEAQKIINLLSLNKEDK